MSNITTCICDGCGLEETGPDSFPVYYEKVEVGVVQGTTHHHWLRVHYCDDCVVPDNAVTQPPEPE